MIYLLTSDIGRGHPFYLDGLAQALSHAAGSGHAFEHRSVFEIARGPSRLAWESVRAAYRLAGRGGLASRLYSRMRGQVDYDRSSALLSLLGRDVARWARPADVVAVDHPLLVGALRDPERTWYLHGEMVVPPEAIVESAARVFVPTDESADAYARTGYPHERILVTGICVESGLAGAAAGVGARRERLARERPLTVAFFSSGAEPAAHVKTLAAAAVSASGIGHRCLAFAAAGGRFERTLRELRRGSPEGERESIEIVRFDSRKELDRETATRFAHFDAVVTPPHERSNWAMALGVPFFLVGPDLGPFAPLNRALLLQSGVAVEIADLASAARFGTTLQRLLETGALREMCERGWGRRHDGFARAADQLLASCEG